MPQVYKKWDKKPEGSVYVGRPSKWGNTFSHKDNTLAAFKVESVEEAVRAYRAWLLGQPDLVSAAMDELAGRDLYCWCYTGPFDLDGVHCHAEVLGAIANSATL